MITARLHRQVFWLLLTLLLLLRIPYTIYIIYFLPIENQNGAAVYEISTYLLTAFLIWWERDALAEFNIDSPALFCILLLRPIQTLILGYWKVDTPLAFPSPLSFLIWAISIILVAALWIGGFKSARLTSRTLGWIFVGLLLGICFSIAENLRVFQSALKGLDVRGAPSASLLASTSLTLLYHLGFAPINEEPLFRGFLFGALRQLKWKAAWIILSQTALFALAHVYFANQYPLMFWVFIPVAAIVLGVLAWRSQSIAPGILAHGLINGSAYLLVIMILRLL